jgi:hypothetical protein
MVAAALIDRLIHHAHIVTLKGKELPAPRERHRDPPPQACVEHYGLPLPGALFSSC